MESKLKQIKKKTDWKTLIFVYGFMAWPIIHFLVFWLYLNIDTVVLTFQTFSVKQGKYVFVGLRNYQDLWKWIFQQSPNNLMVYAIKNSISIVMFQYFVLIPIPVIFAYMMYKKVPGGGFFKVVFFLPNILSDVVMVTLFKLMFDPNLGPIQIIMNLLGMENLTPKLGWFGNPDTAWGMVLLECLWAGIGYNLLLFFSGFNRIPQEVSESARLDGAGMFREFIYISFPLISTTLSTMLILATGSSLSFFMNALILTNGGPDGASSTIMMVIMQQVKAGNSGVTMASTIGIFFSATFLPVIFLIRWGIEKLFPPIEL